MPRRGVLLVAVLAAAAVGYLVLSGSDDDASDEDAGSAPSAPAAVTQATCATGGRGATRVNPRNDAVLGPMALLGARRDEERRPDAFEGQGYKIPVTLPRGAAATLSVGRTARHRVGLVFTLEAQARAIERGVEGADRAVNFVACPAKGGARRRTGWPGGFVVDRPHCATLMLTLPGQAAERHRVALGKSC